MAGYKFAKWQWVLDNFASIEDVAVAKGQATSANQTSWRGIAPFLTAIGGGTAKVLFMGDGDAEGAGVASRYDRFIDRTIRGIRLRWPDGDGDTGPGYTPARYAVPSGGFTDDGIEVVGSSDGMIMVGYDGGLGNRSLSFAGPKGQGVSFAATRLRHLRVHYTARPEVDQSGELEVLADDVPVATINTRRAAGPSSTWLDHDFGSALPRQIVVRKVSGQPRFEGITRQTSLTGITGIDATNTGSRLVNYTHLGMDEVSRDLSDDRHWEAVAGYAPDLGIFSFGRNDMAFDEADMWRLHIREVVSRWRQVAPGAGLIFIMAPQRTMDVGVDDDRIVRFESAVRDELAEAPNVTLIFESTLFAPTEGVDYSLGSPDGYLADESNKSAEGHKLLSDRIISLLFGHEPVSWVDAVASRDEAIKEAQDRLDETALRLNDAFSEIELKPDEAYVDAARQQAIDAAAIDAQAKADQAKADAITDAQGAVSAAEEALRQAILDGDAAAIADAEAKIATAKAAAIDAAADDAAAKASAAQSAAERAAQDALEQAQTDLQTAIASGDADAIAAAEAKIATAKSEAIAAAANDATAKAGEAMQKANAALTAAQSAQATADNAIRTYYSETPPWDNGTAQPDDVLGDMWYRDSTGQAYRWNGTEWKVIQDASIGEALAAAANAQTTADGKITAYYQPNEPLEGDEGDIWFDTDNGSAIHRRTGSQWVALLDPKALADAAEQAAKTAAAADATAKAEAAEAAAAQTAAADATAKANQAKADAEAAAQAYADQVAAGEGSGALAAAKEYAEQKAAAAEAAAKQAAALDATAKAEAAEAAAAATAAADATAKANAAQAAAIEATKITDGDGGWLIHNPVTKRTAGSNLYGTFAIDTPITPTQRMVKVTISGYNYIQGSSEIAAEVGFYAYIPDRPIIQHSFTSSGSAPVTGRLAVKADTGTISILLDHASNDWRYTQLSVTLVEVGGVKSSAWADGWVIRRLPGTKDTEADLSEYTNIIAPPARDMSSKDDAAALADAARIAAEAAAAADATAKAEAAEAAAAQTAAADATAKADQAKADAEAAAKAYTDALDTGASDADLAAARTYAEQQAEAARIAAENAAAADATAKAEAAEAAAAATAAADATAKADAAKQAAIDAAAADAAEKADQAEANAKVFATTTANGLAKIFWSTALPGTTKAPQNSTWYRHSGGKIISVFTQTAAGSQGSAWSARPITSDAIDNLDVGKLTAAQGTVNDLVAQTFATKLASIIQADVGNLTVTGSSNLNDVVAERISSKIGQFVQIAATQIISGDIHATWTITAEGKIVAGDPAGRAVEIDQNGIVIWDVSDDGERYVSSRYGGAGADSMLLTDATGHITAGFNDEGMLTAQGGSVSGDLMIGGQFLMGTMADPTIASGESGWFDQFPRGVIQRMNFTQTTSIQRADGEEWGYGALRTTVYPGRLYRGGASVAARPNNASQTAYVRCMLRLQQNSANQNSPLLAQVDLTTPTSIWVTTSGYMEGYFGVTSTQEVELLSTYRGVGGATPTMGSADMFIEDVGPAGVYGGGTYKQIAPPATGTTPPPASDTKTTYTSVWNATDSGTFLSDGSKRSSSSASGDIIQGYWPGQGTQRGIIAFAGGAVTGETGKTMNQAITSSATVNRVRVRLYVNHTGRTSGSRLFLGGASYSSMPSTIGSTQQGWAERPAGTSKVRAGNVYWFNMGAVDWFNGSSRTIVIGNLNSTMTHPSFYARINGHDEGPSWYRPSIEVTYTR